MNEGMNTQTNEQDSAQETLIRHLLMELFFKEVLSSKYYHLVYSGMVPLYLCTDCQSVSQLLKSFSQYFTFRYA